ncbi:MAG: DUF433 domain-containing protein [Limisphaerales bacterium]
MIAGKNLKVIHLIREHVAYGWSAEELALNHPPLTLGEIYSALAYTADHREEIDRELSATKTNAQQMHGVTPDMARRAARLKSRSQSWACMALSYLFDQHLPAAITRGLRLRGGDVLTAFEDGADRWADKRIFIRATELRRVLKARALNRVPRRLGISIHPD